MPRRTDKLGILPAKGTQQTGTPEIVNEKEAGYISSVG